MSNRENHIWCEKYRPAKIEDCVLSKATKETFGEYVKAGKIPSLLFCGTAGTGKTTAARAICNEIDADWIIINCSDERGIDTLRNKVKQFASTVSFTESKKVIICDEADYLTPEAQAAFRGIIEEFSNHCSFIFTCNFKNKIISAIHSRCAVFEFKIPSDEKQEVAKQIFRRMCWVLDQEGIEYEKPAVAALVQQHFPDFRKTLNELQRYSLKGVIDTGILTAQNSESYTEVIAALKNKKYSDIRKWVSQNSDVDAQKILRDLYDALYSKVDPKSIPTMVLTVAEYSYRAAFVMDPEINTMACLTQLMLSLDFK
jgi:DNA polymerase III delta prime subunit